jgi:SAM-dependent methyltransferase
VSVSFDRLYAEVRRRGYSVLGRSPAELPEHLRELHFGACELPGYWAKTRYRFLRTLEAARRLSPQSVLEVAAGGGFNGVCLVEPGRRVVLNDMRFLAEEIGIWPHAWQIETRAGDLFSLEPGELGQFDLVIASEVIEHVAHGDRFVGHLARFVRPGGRLLITTPNGEYFRSRLPTHSQIRDFSALEAEQFKPDSDGHLYLYTVEEISELLQKSGFSDIEIDLSITPWISGDMMFRRLPKFLSELYYRLDGAMLASGDRIRRRFCTQMIVTASRS